MERLRTSCLFNGQPPCVWRAGLPSEVEQLDFLTPFVHSPFGLTFTPHTILTQGKSRANRLPTNAAVPQSGQGDVDSREYKSRQARSSAS
jgi:hypothetical protein